MHFEEPPRLPPVCERHFPLGTVCVQSDRLQLAGGLGGQGPEPRSGTPEEQL